MITVLKVNVLTDDVELPAELRSRLTEMLQQVLADDPEGPTHARAFLEFKFTAHNRDYMASLQTRPGDQVLPPPKPRKTARKRS